MKAKLSPAEHEIFKTLDKEGATLRQLATNFGFSVSTAERYRNPKYRELGREHQRRVNKREKTCTDCGLLFKDHPRCKVCEILTHGEHLEFCAEHLH